MASLTAAGHASGVAASSGLPSLPTGDPPPTSSAATTAATPSGRPSLTHHRTAPAPPARTTVAAVHLLPHPLSGGSRRGLPPAAAVALAALSLTLLLVAAAPTLMRLSADHTLVTSLHACAVNRQAAGPRPPPSPLSLPLSDSAVHDASVVSLWMYGLLTAVGLPVARAKAVLDIAVTTLWFQATYWAADTVKGVLGDDRCTSARRSTYPNGVSGHYCYFTFVALIVAVYTADRLVDVAADPGLATRRPATGAVSGTPAAVTAGIPYRVVAVLAAAAAALGFFTIGATTTLLRTYAHGYHSGRQVLLGASAGVASALALDSLHFRRVTAPRLGVRLAVVASFGVASLAAYTATWPSALAGEEAVTRQQLVGYAAAWAVVAVVVGSEWRRQRQLRDGVPVRGLKEE
ncbi:hypothetical protein MMPV_004122 [Pyropia vietnamensis]